MADKMTPRKHQERVLERLRRFPGVLAYHSLGSGKTFTAINAAKNLGLSTDIVVPASIKGSWQAEVERNGLKRARVMTYGEALKRLRTADSRGRFLIIDEAHNLASPGTDKSELLTEGLRGRDKLLMLTGTPVRNGPTDAAPLMNALLFRDPGGRRVPTSAKAFNQSYVDERPVSAGFLRPSGTEKSLKNTDELTRMMAGRVDYYDALSDARDMFPEKHETTIQVPMSPSHYQAYRTIIGKSQGVQRAMDKARFGIPLSDSDLQRVAPFLNAARQATNRPDKFAKNLGEQDAEKIQAAFSRLSARLAENPTTRAVIYSNYLDAGVDAYANRLDRAGVAYGKLTGSLTAKQRKELVDRYNRGDLRALLITGAGAEGLDLKRTNLVQLLEPHWHDARTDQAEGRAIRYGSHAGLPPWDRRVDVERYVAVPPAPNALSRLFQIRPTPTADQLLLSIGERKRVLNDQMLRVLRQAGSE